MSGNLSLSKTNGERRYVDTPSSFIVGENSNLSIGKAENTAAIIGTTDNGKIKINEYAGKNLDNIDKMKTVGASVGTSYSKGSNPTLTGVGVNYSNSDLRSTTKNTVVGNVEIGKSSGDGINRDINAMIEITKDDKTNTNVNVEAQTIDYLSNLNKFKEDLELSIVESKATATSIVKKIDNILTNGDDIGQNEKRTLIEIKQSVMEAQNLNQIDIIANTEYSAKDLQDKLGVTIEKFDPNSENLSLAVKERIEELKELGIKETGSPYSLEAFYDKSTKKIFINKDISDDKLRPAIAREWKIKEDLKNNLGKENSQGKLKSTTAGAIAYREVEKRLKNKNDSLSVKDFDVAVMNENSEVTSDKYTNYLEADLKKARTYVKYSLISGYHDFGFWFLSSENRKKHYAESDKIQANFKNDLKAIDKELEEALDKERKAKELLPKVYMVLSKTKNPNARKAFEAYFNHLKRQSDTDNTFLYNVSKGTGIGLAEGATGYYAAEVVGGTTVSLIGISTLFRGDTRVEVPKENEKDIYIPKENRITITYSQALDLKKYFSDYYKDRMGYYNILGLVENDSIPRNTSTLENDPRISEDIAAYYNGERSKLENKGYVVGNIVGNIAGYKLASEGAFYKNNSTYTHVQNDLPSDTTRVGRWMSEEEYKKMLATGKVQMSQADITHVANPADINAFKGAKKGSVYVEFDVKTKVISPGGNENWGIISGPNSIRNRFYKQKGLSTIDEIPDAYNIEIKGRK